MLFPQKSSILSLAEHFRTAPKESIYFADYRAATSENKIIISNFNKISPVEKNDIFKALNCNGYAIVKLPQEKPDQILLNKLSIELEIGPAFLPPYFQNFGNAIELYEGINTISSQTTPNAQNPKSIHNAFTTNEGQDLHVDGTLQDIGQIRTSIILCHTPAFSGGLSTFFNSSAALYKLYLHKPEAAQATLHNNALARIASHRPNEPYIGPVFAIKNDGIHTRFSLDKISFWEPGLKEIPYLKYAYDYLKSLIYDGSPCYKELSLQKGEAAIISNSRISHGRTAFMNGPGAERKMYRGLYERHPC